MTSFADTNVIAYSLDGRFPAKQKIARSIFQRAPRPRTSPQVLRELYSVATTKLGIGHEGAARAVSALLPTVAVVEDAALVMLATAATRRWRLSVCDALIVEAARRAGATTLLSEDLQHGMDFDGVVVRNPFGKT